MRWPQMTARMPHRKSRSDRQSERCRRASCQPASIDAGGGGGHSGASSGRASTRFDPRVAWRGVQMW